MPNRKNAEEYILTLMKDLDSTGYNTQKYLEIFKEMSDTDFNNYMLKLQNKQAKLVFFAPHNQDIRLTTEKLLVIGQKYNVEFFEYLNFTENKDTPDHKTPIKYMVVDLPYKRQSQNLVKKISIPEHNKTIDYLTYQPTGDSKGARISYPELQLLLGLGLERSLDEMVRFRGGDKNGFAAYNSMFLRYGNANIKTLNNYSSGVESTKSLKVYLTSMHISNTI